MVILGNDIRYIHTIEDHKFNIYIVYGALICKQYSSIRLFYPLLRIYYSSNHTNRKNDGRAGRRSGEAAIFRGAVAVGNGYY